MLRKALLILVFIEGAAMAIWWALRGGAFDKWDYWLLVCGWIAFVAVLAVLSHNWRREEQTDVRGFEVLHHDEKP